MTFEEFQEWIKKKRELGINQFQRWKQARWAKQLATTESELRLQDNQHNKRMIKSLDRAAKQLSTSKE